MSKEPIIKAGNPEEGAHMIRTSRQYLDNHRIVGQERQERMEGEINHFLSRVPIIPIRAPGLKADDPTWAYDMNGEGVTYRVKIWTSDNNAERTERASRENGPAISIATVDRETGKSERYIDLFATNGEWDIVLTPYGNFEFDDKQNMLTFTGPIEITLDDGGIKTVKQSELYHGLPGQLRISAICQDPEYAFEAKGFFTKDIQVTESEFYALIENQEGKDAIKPYRPLGQQAMEDRLLEVAQVIEYAEGSSIALEGQLETLTYENPSTHLDSEDNEYTKTVVIDTLPQHTDDIARREIVFTQQNGLLQGIDGDPAIIATDYAHDGMVLKTTEVNMEKGEIRDLSLENPAVIIRTTNPSGDLQVDSIYQAHDGKIRSIQDLERPDKAVRESFTLSEERDRLHYIRQDANNPARSRIEETLKRDPDISRDFILDAAPSDGVAVQLTGENGTEYIYADEYGKQLSQAFNDYQRGITREDNHTAQQIEYASDELAF
jgi:hypothetical protein